MRTYSKTLELSDYDQMTEPQLIEEARVLLGHCGPPIDFVHKAWEYGLVLNAAKLNNAHTILEVGGNGSMFGATAALQGYSVLQVDPVSTGLRCIGQSQQLGVPLPFIQVDFFEYAEKRTFDAVTCICVLEHVEDHIKFFNHMLSFVAPGGLMALTVDFHPSGRKVFPQHLRTYSETAMRNLMDIAKRQGFALFHGDCDYTYRTADVFDLYTFASLIMIRE